ncbi:hypothetical protein QCA50_017544 [Cerrena zonata]|uniref:PH domain-containing protein n=1 Tax=Cerrena zonata TaxID=2478898 RepID=A0AAW0FKE3_9APHY
MTFSSRLHSVLKFTSRFLHHKDAERAGPPPPPPPPKDNSRYPTHSLDFSPDFTPQPFLTHTQATLPGLPRTDDDAYGGVLFLRAGPISTLHTRTSTHDRALPTLPPERPLPQPIPQPAIIQESPEPPPKPSVRKRRFIVDEDERKRKLEEDLKLAAEIRHQREEAERREEEERHLAIQERQQQAKQKRIEQGKVSQELLSQHMKELQESARREQETRRRVLETRRTRSKTLSSETSFGDSPFAGWISVQSTGSPVWRRRYCRVQSGLMRFYKDSVAPTVVTQINLDKVMNLKDASDDFEELESLPNAFAVQVEDDTNYAFNCDTPESKELLVSLITHIAAL